MTARAGNPAPEALAVFFGPALVAGLTAACLRAPGVLYADSGELITAVAGHGIAHPPGFPLFLLLGGLWLDLFGAGPQHAASLLNLFSCVCLGVAAGATALSIRTLSSLANPIAGVVDRVISSWAGGLSFALGPALFDFSLGTEVYTLHAVFLSFALGSLLWARRAGSFREHVAATAFSGISLGCGLAVHHATMAVILPGLLLLFPKGRPCKLLTRYLVFGLASLPGLLTYAVLPYRAGLWPALNWGNPSSLARFWGHVSARDYQVNLDASVPQMLERASALPGLFGAEFFFLGLLFAAAGGWWLSLRDRPSFIGLLTAGAGSLLLALRYEIAEDQAAYYIPAFLITALLAGAGVLWVLTITRSRSYWRRTALAAVVLTFVSGHIWNVQAKAGRRRDSRAIETAGNVLDVLPQKATVLTPEWNVYAPMLPSRLVAGERKDLFVVDVLLLKRGWYLDTQKLRHGERVGAVKEVFEPYRARISDWEEGRSFDADELTTLYNSLNQAFVRTAWREGRPVFWVGRMVPELVPEEALVIPRGLVFEVVARDRGTVYFDDLPLWTQAALRPDLPVDPVFEGKIRPLYVLMTTQRARYELVFRRFVAAESRIAVARALSPVDPAALELQGDIALAQGRREEALECYAAAARYGGDAGVLAKKSRQAAGQP